MGIRLVWRSCFSASIAALAAFVPYAGAWAQMVEQGIAAQSFAEHCAACHADAAGQAPPLAKLRQLSPESVYAALTSGVMRTQAMGLSDAGRRDIATYLSGRAPGLAADADARRMPNRCARSAAFDPAAPAWNGWGVDDGNDRFQPAGPAGLTPEQVPTLKLAWAFGFPGASVVYGQPSVVGGRVFLGLDTGYVYAIDSATGCVHWSFSAQAGVRSAISVGRIGSGHAARYAAFFGDIRGRVYAVDAVTGALLWSVAGDEHPTARITGSPKLYGDRLIVPVSSIEEGMGGSTAYPCCSFRGSVVALDARTGARIWKTYTITAPLVAGRTNAAGTRLQGPSGAAVWASPTLDPRHGVLYIGTGDAYSEPVSSTTDAILALDLATGRLLWSVQDTAHDAWIAACWPPQPSDNCPRPLGPDYDFGASPMLRSLGDGHRLLIAGQKSGIVWAHDPDAGGAVKWKVDLAPKPPSEQGGIVWGGAADEDTAYFGLNSGGIFALQISDGRQKWFTPIEPAATLTDHRGQSGPLTLIPGVVFSGGWDGVIRGFETGHGRLLWQFDTMVKFDTVNGVSAKGGSMGAAGPTVAGGMLFVPSGYVGVQSGVPGNVLLAFAPSATSDHLTTARREEPQNSVKTW
jgi:polyvinyl alcohol dehydrogenase (cytochrome)